jgi:hypothetical protein
MKKIGLQIENERAFDIKSHEHFQRLSFDMSEIVEINETKKEIIATIKPIKKFYFAEAPFITRRGLARALRSIAYKIQHGE